MLGQLTLERSKGPRAAEGARLCPGTDQGRSSTGGALVCAKCGHPITSEGQRMQMGGGHRHTFANPHGVVFQIACYASAPGCSTVGGDQMDFTWFPGYAWAVAQCSRCGAHVGWRFRCGAHVFHGLVYDRLVEAPEPDGPAR